MSTYARELKRAGKRVLIPVARLLANDPGALPIHFWSLDVDAGGRLRYAGHDLLRLAEHGSPVHLLDVSRLDANLGAFQSVPGIEVFYSVKTQPLPWIVERLLARGAGVEVISEHELRLALHLGAPPEKIIYNGPGKSDASIRTAVEAGIQLFNINHLEEVERVVGAARALGRKVRVGVRVVTSQGWSSQFGCSIARGEALAAYERALAAPELEVVGLHAHRGGHIYDGPELDSFAGEVLAFADVLRDRLRFEPSIIDFGGGLGIPTVRPLTNIDKRLMQTARTPVAGPNPASRLDPRTYAQRLMRLVEAHFGARPRPRVVVEPGRALVGNAQALLARVMTTRSSDGTSYAILDAGINVAAVMGSELHQIFRVTGHGAPPSREYCLAGPICQPGDVIARCVRLPELSPGDVLLIMDSGAYFEPDSTSFSFGRPGTLALERERVRVIRRPESFDDLISRDVLE